MTNGFNGIFYFIIWWIGLGIVHIIARCYIKSIVGNNINDQLNKEDENCLELSKKFKDSYFLKIASSHTLLIIY